MFISRDGKGLRTVAGIFARELSGSPISEMKRTGVGGGGLRR